jgi:hypothetical protein
MYSSNRFNASSVVCVVTSRPLAYSLSTMPFAASLIEKPQATLPYETGVVGLCNRLERVAHVAIPAGIVPERGLCHRFALFRAVLARADVRPPGSVVGGDGGIGELRTRLCDSGIEVDAPARLDPWAHGIGDRLRLRATLVRTRPDVVLAGREILEAERLVQLDAGRVGRRIVGVELDRARHAALRAGVLLRGQVERELAVLDLVVTLEIALQRRLDPREAKTVAQSDPAGGRLGRNRLGLALGRLVRCGHAQLIPKRHGSASLLHGVNRLVGE